MRAHTHAHTHTQNLKNNYIIHLFKAIFLHFFKVTLIVRDFQQIFIFYVSLNDNH